jgi:hypothetical protein
MSNLEAGPTMEHTPSREVAIPPEVQEMEKDLVGDAKVIFENNHELVKEAMFGMGSRKAKEVLENLAECRDRTKNAVRQFRKKKEEIYSIN